MMRDKKYLQILAIICIFFASFLFVKPVSAEGWLSNWGNRIKFTIDHTKIDSTLTWFPVTVFLTSTQGEEVFAEFDADEDFDRIAFTTDDGETQLYAEYELFDDSESVAIYHVSKTGWVLDNDVDTDFYMYYDNDAAHNTTYIGAINTTAGAAVWDANTKAVYHGNTLYDSTVSSKDLTKVGTVNIIAGKIANAFSAAWDTNNYLINGALLETPIGTGSITFSFVFKRNGAPTNDYTPTIMTLGKNASGNYRLYMVAGKTTGYISFQSYDGSSTSVEGDINICDNAFHYIVGVRDGTTHSVYVDGELDATVQGTARNIAYNVFKFGCVENSTYDELLAGIIDEVSVSNIARSGSWVKATYNSLQNTLLTYGDEEAKLINGSACSINVDCISDNCQNSICCAAGQTCCTLDSHCPADFFENCQFSDYSCDTTTDHYCKASIDIWCYRINSAQQIQIDKHGVCKDVTDNNASDIFVPVKTSDEWTAFRTNASGVSIAECTLPCVDVDADGYGATGHSGIANGCTYDGDDCCDLDNRAYPGESTYYSSMNNCSSWDYDCSGGTDKNNYCTDYILTTSGSANCGGPYQLSCDCTTVACGVSTHGRCYYADYTSPYPYCSGDSGASYMNCNSDVSSIDGFPRYGRLGSAEDCGCK